MHEKRSPNKRHEKNISRSYATTQYWNLLTIYWCLQDRTRSSFRCLQRKFQYIKKSIKLYFNIHCRAQCNSRSRQLQRERSRKKKHTYSYRLNSIEAIRKLYSANPTTGLQAGLYRFHWLPLRRSVFFVVFLSNLSSLRSSWEQDFKKIFCHKIYVHFNVQWIFFSYFFPVGAGN